MINEDKIREVWASNPERGFKLFKGGETMRVKVRSV